VQHTTLQEWSDPCARLIQAPGDQFDWEAIEADEERTHLLNLIAPQRFYESAPQHWGRPMQLAPSRGIPKHVWLGMDFCTAFADLLKLWPVKRFLLFNRPEEDFELLENVFSHVRCSVCGTRYATPILQCPRVQLCGDAKIIPQIEVFTGVETWAKERTLELGGTWLPWPS
jgi:hypothetical protein